MPDGTTAQYSIAQMSEGERTALYLAARVVSCNQSIMLVDEPETFFHPLLARSFWDTLEEVSPSVRFVYITHDIPFALSRRGAQFAIAKSETKVELVASTSTLPADVIVEVLGAASFSISASRIIFCEGESGSLDIPIYSAWHECPRTAVVPVGSCEAVRECVSVFRAGKVTAGVEAFGYIDRDGWPDSYLSAEPTVKALHVSEIEGLLCTETAYMALGEYYGINEPELSSKYSQFIAAAKSHAKGIVLNKEILNRAKKRVELEQRAMLNPLKPAADIATLKAAFSSAAPSSGWPNYLGTVFSEEEARLMTSSTGAASDFLRDFPAKSYYTQAAQQLTVMPDALVRTFCLALGLSDGQAKVDLRLKRLRDKIVTALTPHLWPRTV